MRILITNDDGIYAAGILPLVEWAKKYADVTVVAPLKEQSAKSHSIDIHNSFQAKKVDLGIIDVTAYAVDSTPADCVRFAKLALKLDFDLVISGINRGYNLGRDIMYSGTASAAFEAAHLGFNSMAISTNPGYYPGALEHMDRVYDFIVKHDLYSKNNIYNVNIPDNAGDILITRQGGPYFRDTFDILEDDHYLAVGGCIHVNEGNLTYDTDATVSGYISITPLALERTNVPVYEELSKLNS